MEPLWSGKTIVVTGGAGFVGSSVGLALKQTYPTARIIAFDNLKRRGSELNVPRLLSHGIEFRHGDIRCPEDLSFSHPIDLIVECSAEPSVLAGYGHAANVVTQINLVGTINCLELARQHHAAIIFFSTSRVYPLAALQQLPLQLSGTRLILDETKLRHPGVSAHGISELFPLAGARSLYGATKLASEILIQEYLALYGLPGVINRCSILAGPWQMGKVDQGVVMLWAARHLWGGSLEYIGYGGQGHQVRDLLHINDLIKLLDIELQHLDQCSGQIYNVGGGPERSFSLRELTAICQQLTGNTITVSSQPNERPGDIPWYVSDARVVQSALSWQPQYSVVDTVRDCLEWLNQHQTILRPILAE